MSHRTLSDVIPTLELLYARGMQMAVLMETGEGEAGYELLLSVSGFGAYSILHLEDGLHILEEPGERGRRDLKRHQIRVHVAPRPVEPPRQGRGGSPSEVLVRQALETFRKGDAGQLAIVRRYRKLPSPLVRDFIRNWRSGHYDAVMLGDFDLMLGSGATEH